MDLAQLNRDYAIAHRLSFSDRPSGFPLITIDNPHATAEISLYGGQVLSYRPKGASADLLFLSDRSQYQAGKAIRGGIPLCWPWFGADPEGLGRANHGFGRGRLWSVRHTLTLETGATQVVLGLEDKPDNRAIWDCRFEVAITITVGESLDLELTTHNRDQRSFTFTQALHSYFTVGDIQSVKVVGLAGLDYIDKVDGNRTKNQLGEVAITGEVDRIYLRSPSRLLIDDPVLNRKITIHSRNSRTAIVWNPGPEKAAAMGDLSPEAYKNFLCVETANVADEAIALAPGQNHSLGVNYRLVG
jgi:glucose-6-phosphate 1-epimerase